MKLSRKSHTFRFEDDLFSKGARGTAFLIHEALLIRKFLQTRPQVKKNKIYYDVQWMV